MSDGVFPITEYAAYLQGFQLKTGQNVGRAMRALTLGSQGAHSTPYSLTFQKAMPLQAFKLPDIVP